MPPPAGGSADYVDVFELHLDTPDDHTAEQWFRAALDGAAPGVVGFVRLVHAHVLRFRQSDDPRSILGWDTVSSTAEALHLTTDGPLLHADLVARRTSDRTASVTTSLTYRGRGARLLWVVVGPLHRRMAPYLLRRAAARLVPTA